LVTGLRRHLGIRRIGHAGTLDPLAQGLLVLLAGTASRLFSAFQAFPKTYRAAFRLGERTDTQDRGGKPLPGWLPRRTPPLAAAELTDLLPAFRGEIQQIPPMFSALKKNGVPLYRLARQGLSLERPARTVQVYSLEVLSFDGWEGEMELSVSSGFYVRSLVDELGEKLATGAVLTNLCRRAIGPFHLDQAKTLAELALPSVN
jgi:tRNA pseudouridine55 synthase